MRCVGLALLAGMLGACGGGGGDTAAGGTDGQTPGPAALARTAYAVDDPVLGATVRILRLSDGVLLHQTLTGEHGQLDWPAGLRGQARIEVSGGFEDIDGLATTQDDRKPFTGQLVTLVDLDTNSAPLLVTALSTGLADLAGTDFATFVARQIALPAELRQLLDLAGAPVGSVQMQQRLGQVAMLTRAGGFDSTRDAVTAAAGTPEALALRSLAVQAGSSAPIARIADLALRECVADAIGQDPQQISDAQLRGLQTLSCARAGVVTLAGVDALAGLQTLNVAGNDISDVRPLRTLAQLEWADLADNRIATVAPLFDGDYAALSLRITRNCIAPLSQTTGGGRVVTAGIDLHARQQYTDCAKTDAQVPTLLPSRASDGSYTLLVRTSYNPAARCQIDWNDGTLETAPCDARAMRYRHSYAGTAPASVRFLVNGQVRHQSVLPQAASSGPVLAQAGAGNHRSALTSPNGGESWSSGVVQTVAWMTQFITGPSVDLYVLWDDPVGLEDNNNLDVGLVVNSKRWHLFASVPNTGTFQVDPAQLSGQGNAYRVLVVSSTDRTQFDLSDANFSLNVAASAPTPVVDSLQCTSAMVGVGVATECTATGRDLQTVRVQLDGLATEALPSDNTGTRLVLRFRVLAPGGLRVSLSNPASGLLLADQVLVITPVLPTPLGNAPGNDTDIGPLLGASALFNWSAVAGASEYEVVVVDRSLGSTHSRLRMPVTSFTLGALDLPAGHLFQWTVAACIGTECSFPTAPLNFRMP